MTFRRPNPADEFSNVPCARLKRRKTKAVAWAGSALFHFAMIGVFLGSASGQLIAADSGADTQGQMTVSVVPASTLFGAPAPDRSGQLRPLVSSFSDQTPVTLAPPPPNAEMARLLQRVAATTPPTPPQDRTAEPRQDPKAAAQAGGHSSPPAPAGSTGGLWGAIEPCWRSLGDASGVPVSLQVIVDAKGELSTPPRILRSAGAALDQRRLLAEARALSALDACMPRGDLRFSGNVYRLDFGPKN